MKEENASRIYNERFDKRRLSAAALWRHMGGVGNRDIKTIQPILLPDSTPSATKDGDHIASGGRGC
jgi:hypothetical protein